MFRMKNRALDARADQPHSAVRQATAIGLTVGAEAVVRMNLGATVYHSPGLIFRGRKYATFHHCSARWTLLELLKGGDGRTPVESTAELKQFGTIPDELPQYSFADGRFRVKMTETGLVLAEPEILQARELPPQLINECVWQSWHGRCQTEKLVGMTIEQWLTGETRN